MDRIFIYHDPLSPFNPNMPFESPVMSHATSKSACSDEKCARLYHMMIIAN